MANDSKISGSRPIDPSKNAEDLMGEVGATGITTGGSQQTSATPGDLPKDDTQLLGGIINDPTSVPANREDPTEYSDKAYDRQTILGMSEVRSKQDDDQASGRDNNDDSREGDVSNSNGHDSHLQISGNDTQEDAEKDTTSREAAFTGEENLGEQNPIGGTEPAPEGMRDVGEAQEEMGLGRDQDGENPQEVSIADAMDKAEDEHLHS